MICQKCDGRGKTTEYDGLRKFWCDYKCEVCNGTGEVMTEQEWLQTATTEQLAEFLLKIGEIDEAPIPCGDLMECSKNCGLYSQCAGDDVMPTNKEIWLEWLKQPHNSPK